MENLPPNIEPTTVDVDSIDQLSLLNDSTALLIDIQTNGYREEYIKLLRRSNFFSEENVRFKVKEQSTSGEKANNSDVKSKTVVTIIIVVVMIIISVVVVKKQKRYKNEDQALLEADPNATYSFFRDIRSTRLGLNTLIVGEIFIYFAILFAALHMLNKISGKTHQVVS